jgi:hypothetical protein
MSSSATNPVDRRVRYPPTIERTDIELRVQRLIPTAMFLLLASATAYAAEVWHLLGSASVTATPSDATAPQHEEIRLPSARGPFVTLRLEVEGGPVAVDRLVVTFAHGSHKAVDLKGKTLKPGDFTPEVAVTGTDHVVRKVEFWYRAPKFATVRLYAR